MLGSGFGFVSDQGTRVEDYLLVFKRRVKLYDTNPDKYRFYPPHILLEGLNHTKAGPFKDEVKAIQAILKEEIRRNGRYHAFLDDYINKQSDPLANCDDETARFYIKLIRDLVD
jgi:hypothetical protein